MEMTRNTDDLDDLWDDREQEADALYAVSIFEHDEINEKDEDKETEQE